MEDYCEITAADNDRCVGTVGCFLSSSRRLEHAIFAKPTNGIVLKLTQC